MREISTPSILPPRPRRWIAAALLVLLATFFVKHGLIEPWGYVGFDFEIFLEAAEALGDGRSPYSKEVFRGEAPPTPHEIAGAYIYPSFFATLLIPLTLISPWVAKLCFILLTASIVFAILFPWSGWGRLFFPRVSSGGVTVPLIGLLIPTLFLLAWGPILENLRFGQSNLLVLAYFACAWRILPEGGGSGGETDRSREVLAGILIGFAALIKLTPFLAVPVFMAARRWRLLMGLAVGTGVGLLFSGWEANREFFFDILPVVTGLAASPRGIDLPAVLDRFLPGSPGKGICTLLILTILFGVHRLRENTDPRSLILLAAFLTPVFTGIWFHHHLLALLPLTVLLARRFEGFPQRRSERGAGVARAALLALALLPGFTYWAPVDWALAMTERVLPFSALEMFTLGQALAFFLLLPDMIQSHERDRRTNRG